MDWTVRREPRRLTIDGALAATAAVMGLAVVCAFLIGGPPAQAAFPGGNGAIYCGGVRGAGQTDIEIFRINPDATNETVLTNNAFRDGSPAVSPDGTKIAFESQRVPGEPGNTEIYVADNDGDLEGPDVKRLTINNGTLPTGVVNAVAATDFSPSWSPDGTQIVFHSGRVTTFNDGNPSPAADFEIYRMSAETGELVAPATRLTFKRGQDAIPSWSPDGSKIAFQGFPESNPSASLPVNLEVFTMNPDGSGLTNVSLNPGTPNDPATPVNENANGLDRDIIWSPDGQQIAFSSTRASTVAGNQNFDVWRANRDGSNPVRLTTNADSPEPEPFTDFDLPLVWSPDGTEILFASSRETTTPLGTLFSAYRMSAATGDATPIAHVTPVSQFQRCDWARILRPQSAAPTPAAPGPGPAAVNPPAAGPLPVVDRAAPRGRLLFRSRTITRRNMLDRNGLAVRTELSEAGTVRVDMYADNGARLPRLTGGVAQARPRLTVLARGSATKQRAGRVTVRVRPTRRGRALLRRSSRTRVFLVATLRDRAGNQRRLARHRAIVR
jgi:Tol biopolymer transport system component